MSPIVPSSNSASTVNLMFPAPWRTVSERGVGQTRTRRSCTSTRMLVVNEVPAFGSVTVASTMKLRTRGADDVGGGSGAVISISPVAGSSGTPTVAGSTESWAAKVTVTPGGGVSARTVPELSAM
jgi:hypothetical protein